MTPLGHLNCRRIATIGVAVGIIALGLASSTRGQQPVPPATADTETFKRSIQQLEQSVEMVRRDQLNYRVEKDLLKEAYGSNLQTINLLITLVLGTLTVLGFLGVRSIGAFRQEFREELQRLTTLRAQFEEKFRDVDSRLEAAKQRVDEIAGVNEQQEQRLRILEIQEKAASLASQGNPLRALDYIKIGLDLAPDDRILLGYQADVLNALGRFAEALVPFERMLELEPNDPATVANTAEAYLVNQRLHEAETLVQKHDAVLSQRYGPYLPWYLRALALFFKSDEPRLREHLLRQPVPDPQQTDVRVKPWRYAEARIAIQSRPPSQFRDLMERAIGFLEGSVSLESLNEVVGQQPTERS